MTNAISNQLRSIANDWDYYSTLSDPEQRASMQRALVVELSYLVEIMCAETAPKVTQQLKRIRSSDTATMVAVVQVTCTHPERSRRAA